MFIPKNARNNLDGQGNAQPAKPKIEMELVPNFLFMDREKLILANTGMEQIFDIDIDKISDESVLKIRNNYDDDTVELLLAKVRSGETLPPLILLYDEKTKKYYVVDGKYRLLVNRRQHNRTVKAVVYYGSINDALRLRLLANANHPTPLDNAEKRRNVKSVLENADWWRWCDGIIAKYCGASPRFVGMIRAELLNDPNFDSAKVSQIRKRLVLRGDSIYEMAVEEINKDRHKENKQPGHKARIINLEIKAKLGDVFVFPIGHNRFPHVLYVGDRCDTRFLNIALFGRKAGLLMKDLPYFVNYTAGGHLNDNNHDELDKIPNDDLSGKEAETFVEDSLAVLNPYLQAGSAYYVWCGLNSTEMVKTLCEKYLGERRSEIVWVKRKFVQGFSHFRKGHEKALFGYTGNKLRYWNGGKSLIDVIDEWKLEKSLFDLPLEIHPSPKPISVYSLMIKTCLERGGLVLDTLCGGGTTLVAAHLVKRTGIGIELVPEFAAVTVKQMLRVVPSFIRTDLKGLPGILAPYNHLPFGK